MSAWLCRLKLSLRANVIPHSSHTNGLRPECTASMCTSIPLRLEYTLPHSGQVREEIESSSALTLFFCSPFSAWYTSSKAGCDCSRWVAKSSSVTVSRHSLQEKTPSLDKKNLVKPSSPLSWRFLGVTLFFFLFFLQDDPETLSVSRCSYN